MKVHLLRIIVTLDTTDFYVPHLFAEDGSLFGLRYVFCSGTSSV